MAEASINPAVLEWAIAESGLSMDEVADGLKLEVDLLEAWVGGEAKPDVTALRRLSKVLKRPPATFFLPRPPARSGPTPKLRGRPGDTRALSPRERLSLRDAHRVQQSVRQVREDLGEEDVRLPAIRHKTAAAGGSSLRRWLGVGIDDGRRLSPAAGFAFWRESLERRGVLVFLMTLDAQGARGFSLQDPIAPVIVASTRYNVHARIFTLFHELAHLAAGSGSVCEHVQPEQAEEEERWCDRVATMLLLPEGEVRRFLEDTLQWRPGIQLGIGEAGQLAREFCVSLTAAAIRLVEFGAANESVLGAIPTTSDHKGSGGGGGGEPRVALRERKYGWGTIGTLLRGVEQQVATRHEARRYLDISDVELEVLEQSH